MKLYLDDERTPRYPIGLPDEECREDWQEWVVVRSAGDAILILATGIVTEVSLDHDLGTYETGYTVLTWIEKQVFTNDNFKCPIIHIHTANPSASQKMLDDDDYCDDCTSDLFDCWERES